MTPQQIAKRQAQKLNKLTLHSIVNLPEPPAAKPRTREDIIREISRRTINLACVSQAATQAARLMSC